MTRDIDADALRMFTVDTRDHVMTVAHDEGLYRHIRFASPRTDIGRFHIVTWPGHLSIGGDRETYVFSRVPDMLAWFHEGGHGRGINPGYWAEKLVTSQAGIKVWDEDSCRQRIIDAVRDEQGEHPGLWRDVKYQLLDDPYGPLGFAETAVPALRDYTFTYTFVREGQTRTVTARPFENAWEWDMRKFDFSYLWMCHALRWGVTQYYAAKAAEPAPVPA